MSEYKHGAYGDSQAAGFRVPVETQSAVVVVGTAPVQQIEIGQGGSYCVNRPVPVYNMADMRKAFGYSEDWTKYTLFEAAHHFFETKGVGPLIMINVLDPTKAAHKNTTATTATKTPVNNIIEVTGAEDAILDSLVLKTTDSTPVTKTKGTDYTVAYNQAKRTIVITGITNLGTDAMTVEYNTVKPSGVTDEDVIGTTDNLGTNKGLYAVRDVYMLTGMIPAYLMAPGWSEVPSVNAAMCHTAKKVGGHWDMWVFADLPIDNGGTPLTMDTIAAYKAANGYTQENETVYFPMADGTDGKKYHLSVLAAANFLELLSENDDVPYHSASNTDAPLIANYWLGAAQAGKVFDDQIINEKLNKYGICSAAFVGGRWAIWGAHAADYDPTNADSVNAAETNRMMLYYISNDFQARRPRDVDRPMTRNDIASIAAEEQSRLDALLAMGALIYGSVALSADADAKSDILSGDYLFEFRVTTTPLAKSLTAVVTWVDEGYSTYFAQGESETE